MAARKGAQYVQVTLEEIERYLKRAFRVMRPAQGLFRGIYYYDLRLSENVGVRVFTSITRSGEVAKGKGKSAIRVGLCKLGVRYLKSGKQPIAKRTEKWRDNLRRRIEDEIEEYDNDEDKWERLAGSTPNQITPPQANMIEGLIDKAYKLGMESDDIERVSRDAGLPTRGGGPLYEDFTKVQASQFIEAIQIKLDAAKKAKERGEQGEAPKYERPVGKATWKRLRNGEWGIQGMNLEEGQTVTVVRRNGVEKEVVVERVVWQGNDGFTYAEIEQDSRRYAAEQGLTDEDEDFDPSLPA
jgi:hypothetical protein